MKIVYTFEDVKRLIIDNMKRRGISDNVEPCDITCTVQIENIWHHPIEFVVDGDWTFKPQEN
jgi:hypothetical protein